VREYALVAILDSGEVRLLSSNLNAKINTEPIVRELERAAGLVPEGGQPSNLHITLQYDNERLTSTPVARQGVWTANPVDSETSFSSRSQSGSEYRRRRRHDHVKSEYSDDEELRRKRPRGRRSPQSPQTMIRTTATQQIRIGDIDRVKEYFTGRLRDFQQTGCKELGKLLVKLMEPKKQTHHPYTKGDAGAPDWWPSTSGERPVPHREPDHLLKGPRLILLVHILFLIVQPKHEQLECFAKLGLVHSVKKTEEYIMDKMTEFFSLNDNNKDKRKYLKEVFKVARQLERFYNGEIDGNTHVTIMAGQNLRRQTVNHLTSSESDSETEADEATTQHEQRRREAPNTSLSNLVLQTQPNYSAPVQHQQHFEAISVYEQQQPRTFEHQNPTALEPLRRPFGSPVYSQESSAYPWTPSPTSIGNTPPSSTYYTTSPHQAMHPPASYSMGSAPPMTATLPPLQHTFESVPRYDMQPMGMGSESMRQSNMGFQPQPQVTTSFADNMFGGGQYQAASHESLHHPHQ